MRMRSKLAKKVARKHLTRQFNLRNRNASDFLGERSVARNTGYGDRLHPGPGNAFQDEIVAEDFEAEFFGDELESDEIIDDLDRMSDFWKESRLPSHRLNSPDVVEEAVEKWREDNPEVAQKFDDEKVEDEKGMRQKMRQAHYEIIDDLDW